MMMKIFILSRYFNSILLSLKHFYFGVYMPDVALYVYGFIGYFCHIALSGYFYSRVGLCPQITFCDFLSISLSPFSLS